MTTEAKYQMLKAYQEHMKKSFQQRMVLDDNLLPIYSEQIIQLPSDYVTDIRFLDRYRFIARPTYASGKNYTIISVQNQNIIESECSDLEFRLLPSSIVFEDILQTNTLVFNWKSQVILHHLEWALVHLSFGDKYLISIGDCKVVVRDCLSEQVCVSYDPPEGYTRTICTMLYN